MVRHQGIPTRNRVGSAADSAASSPDLNVSDETADYWDSDKRRWRLVDPELDDRAVEKSDILFGVHDIPPDQSLMLGRHSPPNVPFA